MKRSVPELTTFLADWLKIDRATVGNIIRKCREAGLLSPGRHGRGAAAVTSRDAASVLVAILSADRPLEAAASLKALQHNFFNGCSSQGKSLENPPTIPGLEKNWHQGALLDVLVTNIEARLHDPACQGVDQISLTRGFVPRVTLRWWAESGHRYEFEYVLSPRRSDAFPLPPGPPPSRSPNIKISELHEHPLSVLGDWLKGDDTE